MKIILIFIYILFCGQVLVAQGKIYIDISSLDTTNITIDPLYYVFKKDAKIKHAKGRILIENLTINIDTCIQRDEKIYQYKATDPYAHKDIMVFAESSCGSFAFAYNLNKLFVTRLTRGTEEMYIYFYTMSLQQYVLLEMDKPFRKPFLEPEQKLYQSLKEYCDYDSTQQKLLERLRLAANTYLHAYGILYEGVEFAEGTYLINPTHKDSPIAQEILLEETNTVSNLIKDTPYLDINSSMLITKKGLEISKIDEKATSPQDLEKYIRNPDLERPEIVKKILSVFEKK